MAKFNYTKKDLDRSLKTDGAFPIDAKTFFSSKETATKEAKDAVEIGENLSTGRPAKYFFGQQVCVLENDTVKWFTIEKGEDGKGCLKEFGARPRIGADKIWYVGDENLGVKAEGTTGDTITIKSIEFVEQNDDGWAINRMTLSDGSTKEFLSPPSQAIVSPVNGFFTMSLDDKGNLYAYSAEGGTTPQFEYNGKTGELFHLTQVEGAKRQTLIGNLGLKLTKEELNEYIVNHIKDIGVEVDLPLKKGDGEKSLAQSGSIASGAYSFSRGAPYVMVDTKGGEVSVSNKATGVGATAEGTGTLAEGDGSHAEGAVGKIHVDKEDYRPTTARQRGAHAEGCGTVANGKGAHSEGYVTEATAEGAHAEGKRTTATAEGAHSEGKGLWDDSAKVLTPTEATGEGSHAEGMGTKANGKASHAEGLKGKAIGNHSHVEGADGEARGNNSHVEGWGCITDKNAGASHAGGEASRATAYASFAHGFHTIAQVDGQFVVGFPNKHEHADAIFVVGNGEIDEDYNMKTRSNAFEVLKNGTAIVGGKQVATLDDVTNNMTNFGFEMDGDGNVYLLTGDSLQTYTMYCGGVPIDAKIDSSTIKQNCDTIQGTTAGSRFAKGQSRFLIAFQDTFTTLRVVNTDPNFGGDVPVGTKINYHSTVLIGNTNYKVYIWDVAEPLESGYPLNIYIS